MKKYFRLFVFLLVAGLILSTSVVKAEDGGSEVEGSVRTGIKGDLPGIKFKGSYDIKEAKGARATMHTEIEADREAFKEKLKTDREAFKGEVEKEKADFKNANLEKKKEFWSHLGIVLGQRFVEATTRLGEVQGKVADVIAKLKTDGKDTATAQADLDLSIQKLKDAKAKLDALKALLPTDGSKLTAEIFAQVKLDARDAKDLLKESKSALQDAIKEIHSLKGEAKVEGNVEGGAKSE